MDRDIKAIFFDVDGTLVSHKSNNVPPGTRRSLARLRAKGIKTVVATGRHKIELEKLPVNDMQFDGYLTLNGDLMLDENKKHMPGPRSTRVRWKCCPGYSPQKKYRSS